ncbi:thiol-disulfide oxidoreductase DCC family protein [Pseudomonas citronellolis]|uniref:thiol-disulfide oxidoreductase DCC family protein n=1 Tax=Pseudomonas citronellolis TaxID=53408 RepID=UPI0023E3F82E|nr:thiol-disulfide oxidoreductase DCC family protein [Pseudomonas citronellolis]MDF3933187.1 thiol-disulfide oxidoreductase DCC family protein [Pseudomonas citronellolis]
MELPPHIGAADRVVLFDGVCRLCNGWSRFLIRHDRAGAIRLCSVQSAQGQAILAWFGLPQERFDTMLYVEGPKAYEKSEAFLRVIAQLPAPWRWLRGLRLLPRGLRDWGYDRIAQNRYRLFGRYEQCLLPAPEHRARFLDQA